MDGQLHLSRRQHNDHLLHEHHPLRQHRNPGNRAQPRRRLSHDRLVCHHHAYPDAAEFWDAVKTRHKRELYRRGVGRAGSECGVYRGICGVQESQQHPTVPGTAEKNCRLGLIH